MKTLRVHITKIFLACFIWTGIGLYLIQPAQAQTSSHSFTNWLKTVVKKDQTGEIRQQIYKLKTSEGSLTVLIEKASEMVSRNNDDFNLPISDNPSDAGEVYNLLIVEWNSYQTGNGNGMGKASGPETVKSNLNPTVDKFAQTFSGKADRKCDTHLSACGERDEISRNVMSYAVEPLSGGIAIGAP